MARIIGIIVSIAILLSIGSTGLAGSYKGNLNSGIFHYYSCKWAQKIHPNNVVLLSSRREAIEDYHMRPCKVCRP